MKAKVLSVIVIVGVLGYLLFGVIPHLPLREPPATIPPIEGFAVVLTVVFIIIGVVVTGYASIKWIIK